MDWGTEEWFQDKLSTQGSKSSSSYFGHQNNGYQRYRHQIIAEQIYDITQLISTSNVRLLDIGCGTGECASVIQEFNRDIEIIGIDFLQEAIILAKERHKTISFRTESLPDLAFSKSSFDIILASEVLYYLSETDRKKAISEIYRVLATNGWLIITSTVGDKYLSLNDIRKLLHDKFLINKSLQLHLKLFHTIMKPVNALSHVQLLVSRREFDYLDKRLPNFLVRHKWLYNNLFSKALLKIISFILFPIAKSKKLPLLFNYLGKFFAGDPTNIIVISYKGDKK